MLILNKFCRKGANLALSWDETETLRVSFIGNEFYSVGKEICFLGVRCICNVPVRKQT